MAGIQRRYRHATGPSDDSRIPEELSSVIAKRQKCVPSRIPLKVIGEYLGGEVKKVPRPDNWRDVVYGKTRFISNEQTIVQRFLTMNLSKSPGEVLGYY